MMAGSILSVIFGDTDLSWSIIHLLAFSNLMTRLISWKESPEVSFHHVVTENQKQGLNSLCTFPHQNGESPGLGNAKRLMCLWQKALLTQSCFP